MLGTTVRYQTMLGSPMGEGEARLIEEFGGIEALLDFYRRSGIESLELSMITVKKSDPDKALEIVRGLQSRGFHVTLHSLLEGISGKEHFDFFAGLYETALKNQQELCVAVHSMKTREETAACLQSYVSQARLRYPGRVRFALENQRIHHQDGSEAHWRMTALSDSLPGDGGAGLCWDFGHYGYNQQMEGMPLQSPPPDAVLKRVIHTHIHSMKELDTHHPLKEEPTRAYLAALKAAGYQGVYNLELMTQRFYDYYGARRGTEDSIRTLKELLI